jgi:hypothetical protein
MELLTDISPGLFESLQHGDGWFDGSEYLVKLRLCQCLAQISAHSEDPASIKAWPHPMDELQGQSGFP